MNTAIAFATVALWLGFLYVWIDAIVGIARIPESSFRRGGRSKAMWIAIVVLTTLIGILVWNYWGHRRAVVRAGV